jgi:hypothetical protein
LMSSTNVKSSSEVGIEPSCAGASPLSCGAAASTCFGSSSNAALHKILDTGDLVSLCEDGSKILRISLIAVWSSDLTATTRACSRSSSASALSARSMSIVHIVPVAAPFVSMPVPSARASGPRRFPSPPTRFSKESRLAEATACMHSRISIVPRLKKEGS